MRVFPVNWSICIKPPSSLYKIDEVSAFTLFKEINMLAIKVLVALLLSSCDYGILFKGIEQTKSETFDSSIR